MDWLKPMAYALEKKATSRNIPDVSSIANRWKLQATTLEEESSSSSPSSSSSFDHSLWDQVLKRHVYTDCTVGSIAHCHAVDYQGIAEDEAFAQYLNELAAVNLSTLSNKSEQLALWINAYNALCINLIVQADQNQQKRDDDGNDDDTRVLLRSINELSNDVDGPVWDQVAGTVGGIELSLNGIEHVQLRAQWDEPSLHSCIVCASASCPNLRREAFVASRLREQMTSQMNDWLSHPTKGLCMHENQLWLSRIFLWFGNDFGNTMSGISSFPFFGDVAGEKYFRAWLAQFLIDKALATRIEYGNDGFRYFDYDWKVNRWTKQQTKEATAKDDETTEAK
jgi:hypothetical protein